LAWLALVALALSLGLALELPASAQGPGDWDEVWVDDDYDSNTPGWGIDHFDKIQDGINVVGSGRTVYVLPGTYTENLVIPKPLTLSGAGAGVTTVYPATSDTGDCSAPALGGSQMVVIMADDVTIEGFTFDGDDPSNGAGIDARNGIVTDPTNAPDQGNNLTVRYNVIQNIYFRGVEARGVSGFSGINFNHNTVDNVDQCAGNSLGLSLHTNASGSIKDNTVTNCDVGILVYNGSDGEVIENEVLHSTTTGIGVNGNDAPTRMCYNTVIDGGTEGCMQTMSVDAPVDICCNEVSSDDSDGIIILGGQSYSQEIYDNYVHDGDNNVGLKITTDPYGWGYEDSHGVNAWGNRIIGWDMGVLADVPAPDVGTHTVVATVSGNNISGSATWGAQNNDANSTLDATNNWWGSPTGPQHTGNPGATGNPVSDNVLYNPWAQALVVLDPWRTELHECEEVTLDVKVRANNVYGVQFIVHFDPTNLEATSAGWDEDPFFPDHKIWDAVVDHVNGTVKFAAVQRGDIHPDAAYMDFDKVAHVVFHCIGPGDDHVWLEKLMLGEKEEGTEIPSIYTSAYIKNVPPEPGTITGQVDLQGRTNEQGAIVTVNPGGYWSVSDSSGNYTIPNVPPGTYTVNAEMTLYLDGSKSGVMVNAGATTTLNQVRLLGSDCNDDDIVNLHDATIMGPAFDSEPGDPNWDPRADINADGKVNILDAGISGGNWNKPSPVNWP